MKHPATADLCDRFQDRLQVLTPGLRSFGGRRAFSGPVSTLKVHEDNTLLRAALEEPGHGRVLVVDGGGSLRCALLGDQLAALAVRNGWCGVVVWGCVRDSLALAGLDLGVLALEANPMRSVKRGAGVRDLPVQFLGARFEAGAWLYADEDGVVVAGEGLA